MADTKRDIKGRVKVNAEDVAYNAAWLTRVPAGSAEETALVAAINSNVTAITTSMAAYAAALP